MGRHGPLQKDRVPTYTVEERRAMHLARIRKKQDKINKARRARREAWERARNCILPHIPGN
jgi:hypothetical protein